MSTRIRGELFNRLDKAARDHDRPLGHEVELRLEQSFAPPHPLVPPEHLVPALLLLSHYLEGAPSVVHWLLNQPGADEERWLRWQAMESTMHTWRAQHIELFEAFTRKLQESEQ